MREIKFRGKRVDNGDWVYGGYYTTNEGPYVVMGMHSFHPVIPETVGQLRYEKDGVEYYDGDVYYHAGHGNEQVSDICNLQFALYVGESQNIEHIIGNIHDNSELLIP